MSVIFNQIYQNRLKRKVWLPRKASSSIVLSDAREKTETRRVQSENTILRKKSPLQFFEIQK